MCGIIGYVSQKQESAELLLDALKMLEYRGYDSCGIAIADEEGIQLMKAAGKILNLEKKCPDELCGCSGIGHTRWATHGAPTERNAHPHQLGDVILVHNGIIENADQLREKYIRQGIQFASQTDTEVICAVIQESLAKERDRIEALRLARKQLTGSYALAIMFRDERNRLYAMRKDSPLLFGIGKQICFLASDLSAFLKYTDRVVELEENELAVITADTVLFIDDSGKQYEKEAVQTMMSLQEVQKNGYDTYLMKEIQEQPEVIDKTIRHYMKASLKELEQTMPDLSRYRRFLFVGCGSAMHAGMVARQLMERKAGILSGAELASEFRYADPIMDTQTCVVFISQSGETADTLAALRMCRSRGIDTIAVVNVPGSSLAKEADVCLPTLAGREISVATTKAYSAQVAVLALLCLKKAMQEGRLEAIEQHALEREIRLLPQLLRRYLKHTKVKAFAAEMQESEHAFFIGRGLDYALSLEGSLKLKEISYLHSEAYAAGELKHGTISLIEPGTPVVVCITDEKLAEKTISNMKEVMARGAKILLLMREDLIPDGKVEGVQLLELPAVHSAIQAVVSILPYQLLAYEIAKARGCDIDQPRNLAKSVTVE